MDQKPLQERVRELVSLLMPSWHPTTIQVLWAIRITIVLAVAVAIGYAYGITLWDWLKLLIVPAVIAAGGLWFNQQQQERGLQIADQRFEDETLQAYIAQISELLRDQERPLGEAQPGDTVSIVAQQLTRAVLVRVDGRRKGQVLQFLYESDLITKDNPVLSLQGFILNKVSISGANLSRADLSSTSLQESDLRFANLEQADLRQADLTQSDLRFANLEQADLRQALLWEADLSYARVGDGASLSRAYLGGPGGGTIEVMNLETGQRTQLGSATMPDGRKYQESLKDPEGHEEARENSSPE